MAIRRRSRGGLPVAPNAQSIAVACCTTGRFEITPEMLQVWDGNGRKLLCADVDTLTRGASQPGRFAFIHRDNGMGKFLDCECLQEGRLAGVVTTGQKGHLIRLEHKRGRRLETFEILNGHLRDHGVNDSQAEDAASFDKVGHYAER